MVLPPSQINLAPHKCDTKITEIGQLVQELEHNVTHYFNLFGSCSLTGKRNFQDILD